MMDYENIFLFVKVVHSKSIINASKKFNIGQATISRRIKQLEKQLGYDLFITNNKGFTLSKDGEQLYKDFKNISAEYDNTIDKIIAAKNSPRGTIKILLPPVLALNIITPHLPKFKRKYPEIDLHIYYQNQEVNLNKDGFDVALINHIPQQQTQTIKMVYSNAFSLYCTTEYKRIYGVPLIPEDLSKHLVNGYMLEDSSIPNKFKFIHKISGEAIFIDIPKRIITNNTTQNRQMLFSNKMIVGIFNDIDSENIPGVIKVLPEYYLGEYKYYLLKPSHENKLIHQLFCDFIEDLLNKAQAAKEI